MEEALKLFGKSYSLLGLSFILFSLFTLLLSLAVFLLIILIQWFIIYNLRSVDVFGHEQWYNFLLPSILISIHPTMYFANVTREALEQEAGEYYTQVAFSKGFTRDYILFRHMMKNSASILSSHIPSVMLYIMFNLLIIEWLMDYKGAAYRLFKAIGHENQVYLQGSFGTVEAPLILGIVICFMIPLFLAQLLSLIVKKKTTGHLGRD
ncbi:ABC transporter permease subunit [Litchfieldia alkalitelluris]|uniref:ABC transporter permease subunit n=1 Tax=Litchfieldia alkalitelluris TaxID=304268 RepID=UPI0009965C58|nr:ABC transporter permease subunit [Litchfieldia alkalitelluris]